MNASVGMRVQSKSTNRTGTISEINTRWNWFKIKWDTFKHKGDREVYEDDNLSLYFSVLDKEDQKVERADRLLRRANSGQDDYWRDYDY